MSRPRTNLKVLEARGSIKKNPQRYRDRLEQAAAAPPPSKLGDPPARWDVPPESMGALKFARWKAIWLEFAPQIPDHTPMKRPLLEMFCEQMDRFRTNPNGMKTSERANMLSLIKLLSAEGGQSGGSKKPEGFGGQWEEFG